MHLTCGAQCRLRLAGGSFQAELSCNLPHHRATHLPIQSAAAAAARGGRWEAATHPPTPKTRSRVPPCATAARPHQKTPQQKSIEAHAPPPDPHAPPRGAVPCMLVRVPPSGMFVVPRARGHGCGRVGCTVRRRPPPARAAPCARPTPPRARRGHMQAARAAGSPSADQEVRQARRACCSACRAGAAVPTVS